MDALDRLLIGEALANLSVQDRAVIRRSYYQGCTTAQIADDLQIAEGAVKSRLHYAVRALRLTLQDMGVTCDATAVSGWAVPNTAHIRGGAARRRCRDVGPHGIAPGSAGHPIG